MTSAAGLVVGGATVLSLLVGCSGPQAGAPPASTPAPPSNPFPQDVSVTAIEIASDETGGDAIFLGTERGQIWKTEDDGASWVVLELPDQGAVLDIAIAQGDLSGELFAGTASGLFRSVDGGKTWTELEKDRFKRVWTVSLSPDYARDGRIAIVAAGLMDFGDGTGVKVADKCGPEPTFLRQFEQVHTYEAPGMYEALLYFGPLLAFTVVEVGN